MRHAVEDTVGPDEDETVAGFVGRLGVDVALSDDLRLGGGYQFSTDVEDKSAGVDLDDESFFLSISFGL